MVLQNRVFRMYSLGGRNVLRPYFAAENQCFAPKLVTLQCIAALLVANFLNYAGFEAFGGEEAEEVLAAVALDKDFAAAG